MSQLFDDVSRLVGGPLPWWQTLGNILGLLAGTVLAVVVSGRAGAGRGGEEPAPTSRQRISSRPDLHRAYTELAELERYATAMVIMLDEQLRTLQADEASAEERLALLEGERELLMMELPINEKLRTLYTTAAEDGQKRDNDPLLVRMALLHWMVLLRRRSMQGFHTRVEGLEDDPDCRGDIIGDQLFERYFNALFEEREENNRDVNAVRTLADLARQSACLGAQQSAQLTSDLYWSFVELRGFLRLNGLERLVPYVAQSAAAPLLLFYDVEKYRGPQSPLARWFAENYEWLIQGVETKRIPLIWHGLWLYDRRTGRLFGYRPTTSPSDENDVHLAWFFASIVSRENLGRYDCSFAEMVERGPTSQGYLCAGSICAEAKRSGTAGAPPVRPKSGRLQSVGSVTKQLSQAGFSEDLAKTTLCNQPSSGGRGGAGGGRLCSDGVTGLGRGWSANTVRCVSQQVMQPGQKLMRCVAEAMGLCSNPLDKATKELQQAMFAGVRLGHACEFMQLGEGGLSNPREQERRKLLRELLDLQKRLDKLNELGEELNELMREAEKKRVELERRQAQSDAEKEFFDRWAEAKAAFDEWQKAKEREKAAYDAYRNNPNTQTRDAYNTASIDTSTKEAEYREKEQKLNEAGKNLQKTEQGGRLNCPPDTPDCGSNNCTAMSSAVGRVMQCFEHEALEEELDMLRRQPGFVDAPLADPQSPIWAKCFEEFDEVSTVNKECWVYDCGPQVVTGLTAQGKCGCGPEVEAQPGAKLNGMCNKMLCSGGTPTVRNGKCVCGGEGVGGTFEGIGPVPVGPFITSAPRLFSEVHFADMGPHVGLGVSSGLPLRP